MCRRALTLLTVAALAGSRVVAAAGHDLAPVMSFHYQLQGLDVAAASASPFPLLVTDYSLDGSEAAELSPAQVASLRSGGRIVLAYLSIGEAETYRFYWNAAWDDEGPNDPDRPPWLGPANRRYPDNIKVRFWDPAWQAIIYGSPGAYLDRILAQGFDGVYLDLVDAYEFWGPDGNGERPSAAEEMRTFVEGIAAYARAAHPGFYVVPQNAAPLVSDPAYLAAISGIGAEDTWFNGNRRQRRYQTDTVVPLLDLVRDAGKAVLAIDYPTRPRRIADFFDRAEAKGYGAYAATRALDTMAVHTGHPPLPGPSVELLTPAAGQVASSSAAPTFTWSAGGGAVRYRIELSPSPSLRRVKTLPHRRRAVLTATHYTPTRAEWRRLARLARRGGGRLYWWVVAWDGAGAQRSARARELLVSSP